MARNAKRIRVNGRLYEETSDGRSHGRGHRLNESLAEVAPKKVGTFELDKAEPGRTGDEAVYFDTKTHVEVRFFNGGGGVELTLGRKILCDCSEFYPDGPVTSEYVEAVLRGIGKVLTKDLQTLWNKIRPKDILCFMYNFQTTKRSWLEGKFNDAIRDAVRSAGGKSIAAF